MQADEVHASDRARILVTHDERLIDPCDRIIRIEDGEITTQAPASHVAADGKHEQESPSLLRKILRH